VLAFVKSVDGAQRTSADGIYAVVEVTCEPATVAELDRQLGLNESVLRTKVLRIERKRVPAAAS